MCSAGLVFYSFVKLTTVAQPPCCPGGTIDGYIKLQLETVDVAGDFNQTVFHRNLKLENDSYTKALKKGSSFIYKMNKGSNQMFHNL